ncbi:response regulator [Piscinibacter defluvii]|uniref:response regulator n=1 Tax=Piscinibacter defluvii TaxID=1796922 RepID=UPI000FDE2EC2|nr:response regulator [Piscinibacter defluvii]
MRAALQRRVATLSLQRRLTWLVALCAGLTAALGMVAVACTGWWLQQERAREDSHEVVLTLAYALQASLAFDDAKGVADTLAMLRARPEIVGAWVHDARGRVVGRYGSGEPPAPDRPGGLASGRLTASQDVLLDGVMIGRVTITNELSRLWATLLLAVGAMGAASLLGFAATVLVARRLAGAITRPVAQLARVAGQMAADPARARPLARGGGLEVGAAVDAFNRMLDEIAKRDRALLDANRALERRVAERTEALRHEKERAEAASVAKTRFLANMSHELRTPLNAVIGAAQLMQGQEAQPPGQAHLVEVIRQSGLNLLGLIENVLDLARIETGALELAPEDFNLLDCAEAAVATAAVPARLKGLQMAVIVDPALQLWRHGDPLRLRQVLLNLLGNAVKFTLRGEVVLRVEAGPRPGALRIVVSDTGIGIGEGSLEQVFKPFRQADDGANRRFGGSGLGLAISRQLVEAMGGRIGVRSRLGAGSTFGIELELPDARVLPTPPGPLRQAVLYCEPHEAGAAALEAQLVRLGCSAQRCRTPDDLERALAEHPASAPWLLVALDDARAGDLLAAAAARLDAQRVIGLSGGESPEVQALRERFGVARSIVKPVLRSALVSRLGAAASVRSPAGPAGAADAGAAHAPHVLVVEDDRVNQAIVCAMLRHAGFQASTADDGAQALALLAAEDYDLVLMDWQMPDMDGLEVTRRLRAGAAGRHGKTVPIVALTANAFVEDRAACLAAGMNDFLTKPVLAASLEASVARWTVHARRAPEAPPSLFGELHVLP